MFIRSIRWGLPLLAMGLLCPGDLAFAQDATSQDAQEIPKVDAPAETSKRPISGLPGSAKKLAGSKPQKVHDGDVWKKHPPPWTIKDPTPHAHPYASQLPVAPGIGAYPGGVRGQFGSPYYYQASQPDTAYANGFGYANGAGPIIGAGGIDPALTGGYDAGAVHGGGFAGDGYYSGPASSGDFGGYGAGGYGSGGYAYVNGYRGGSPTAALPGNLPGSPYDYHFGPGFYRYQEAGHYRFPYYSYRRPWYFPGHPSYNRDTNIPW
jgi:hypothetical protein